MRRTGLPDDTTSGFTGEGFNATQREAQDVVRRLATFNKTTPALTEGALPHFAPVDGVYAHVHTHAQQRVLASISQAKEVRQLGLTRFAEALGPHRRGTDVLRGEAVDLSAALDLAAAGLRVLALP